MDWQKMSRGQRESAQRILGKLRKAGVETSVSQVAKEFENAACWDAGEITLATLCDRTGWSMPDPTYVRETIHAASLPTPVLRHVREVLERDGSAASREALELLPAAEVQ